MPAAARSSQWPLMLACLALPSACTTAQQAAHDPNAERELAAALEGRQAGEPMRCIHNDRSVQVEVIDDRTILYRDGRTVYVQYPPGGCPGLGSGAYTLVTRPFGSQLCERDINNLVNLRSGIRGPICTFGSFIPYTRQRS